MIYNRKPLIFNLNDPKQAESYRKIFHPTKEEQDANVAKMKARFAEADEGLKRFCKAVEDGRI